MNWDEYRISADLSEAKNENSMNSKTGISFTQATMLTSTTVRSFTHIVVVVVLVLLFNQFFGAFDLFECDTLCGASCFAHSFCMCLPLCFALLVACGRYKRSTGN